MNHKEYFEKNGRTKLMPLFPSDDDVEVEELYQAFKARMQAEALASSRAKFAGITFESDVVFNGVEIKAGTYYPASED